MKTKTLTILIPTLLFSLAVAGQSKKDTLAWYTNGIARTIPTLLIDTVISVKYDTVKCWFKELMVDSISYMQIGKEVKPFKARPLIVVHDSTIVEAWQKGFEVRIEHPGSERDSDFIHGVYTPSANMVTDYYLYSDRKTVVKNQVVYSINR